jgi:ABC-type transport system involved in cytochrome bd biosynthesis fused ATPase/permease subunit
MKGTALRFIYKITMGLRHDALKGSAMAGRLVSLAAADIEFLDFLFFVLYVPPWFVCVPFTALLLYLLLGLASVVGVSLFVLFTIILLFNARAQQKFRLKAGKGSDRKMKLLNNIIEGIRIVKMYAWEPVY